MVVPPPQGGLPPGEEAPPTQVGPPPHNTFVLNQTLVNAGCSFVTVTTNDTLVAVEQVVQVAEVRHYQAIANLVESANHEHQQRVAELTWDANPALQRLAADAAAQAEHVARHHAAARVAAEAAHFSKVSQLETALELMEHQKMLRRIVSEMKLSPAPLAPCELPRAVLLAAPILTTLGR